MILICDDDPTSAELMRAYVDILHLSTCISYSAEDALHQVRISPRLFEKAILDVFLPGMNGQQLAAELRKLNPNIEILFYTGLSDRFNQALLAKEAHILSKADFATDGPRVVEEFLRT